MAQNEKSYIHLLFPFILVASSAILFFTSLHSFLLFHTLVELFTVIISFGIFIIAWSSRRYIDNPFLVLIGISYFFIGGLDLIHMLSYKGMNLIVGDGANLPTQLWVAGRYLEAASFIGALLFLSKNSKKQLIITVKSSYIIFCVYAAIFLAILSSIFFLDIFPRAYIEGVGQTSFKIYSEYAISAIFALALTLLFKKERAFGRDMINLLSLALIMKIFSELAFTQYVGVYDFANSFGHIFRYISFMLMYMAVFEVGLDKPLGLMFSSLKKSEERYRSLVEFSPDPIVVHGGGKIIYANEPAKKLFGAERYSEIIGAELAGFFHPKYRERIRARMKKIFSGEWKQAPTTEMEVLRLDGKAVPVEVKGMKIVYEGRDVVESIIRDISERRRAEKKIRSLAQFPEENPNPVIRAMSDGAVQYANAPAKKMLVALGWNKDMQVPEPLFSVISQVLEKSVKQEVEISCPDGAVFSMVLAPSSSEHWVNIYGRDITERKEAERKLARAQAELQKRIEMQLMESYQYLGLVNRKISLLLELEKESHSRKSKQEVVDYIINSALGLSGAKLGILYVAAGQNHFSLVSSAGLEKEKIGKLQMVTGSEFDFINKITKEKRRTNGPCEADQSATFNGNLNCSYFVSLPLLEKDTLKGFLYLGFWDRKSMDPQELEFLDVFTKHVSFSLTSSGILN